jgi:hypothetical protein
MSANPAAPGAEGSSMNAPEPETEQRDAGELDWVAPTHRATPTEALPRIEAMCRLIPELYGAMSAVQSTHLGLPREIIALAIKQYRRDTDALTQQDVVGLLTSLWTGGREGFDAVLRSRKSGGRRVAAAALPWAQE